MAKTMAMRALDAGPLKDRSKESLGSFHEAAQAGSLARKIPSAVLRRRLGGGRSSSASSATWVIPTRIIR